eukprot:CAMPEP_0194303186 /NCGR_PEP_ID=MMETSP0171-20130528/1116_1 /TAXON_ID=218684 /ORGANISM="Corethron pennatum, Strain L29A3" /LENGTH=49 /DNA_ID=CAMNT_0039053997 /DNA_START=423 /DNA_END=572 /DNA_ORIENTATION=-
MKVPDRTVGSIIVIMGKVPTMMGRRSRPISPQATDTGQSGPPTRIFKAK